MKIYSKPEMSVTVIDNSNIIMLSGVTAATQTISDNDTVAFGQLDFHK